MADTTTVVEGRVKFRDGRKWKQRWCVLKKPSPVADRLQVLLYKDMKDAIRDGRKPKTTFFVENFFGLVSGFCHDKETTVMAVISHKQIAMFAFEALEHMIQFEIKIRHSLGEEHQFPVQVVKAPPHSRLPLDKVTMMIHGQHFCMVAHIPPKVLQAWHISDLRRFGAVDGKFCFEGGSRCGKGAGVHAVQSDQSEDVANVVRLGSLGRTAAGHLRNVPSKRGSQVCEPFSFTAPGLYNGSHKAPDHRLSCCQKGLEAADNWTWHKRHSISVTDYSRVGGQIEKLKLQNSDTLERQRLMAIYDIPPKLVRKVEAACARSGTTLARISDDFSPESRKTLVSTAVIQLDLSKVSPSTGGQQSREQETTSVEESSKSSDISRRGSAGRTSHSKAHWEKTSDLFYGQGTVELGVIESEVRMAFDKSKRKEALQKLQQEEHDLQREISLLDEILQVCKFDDDPSKNANGEQSEEMKGTKSAGSTRTKASSLPPRPKVDITVELPSSSSFRHREKAPSEPPLSEELEVINSPNLLGKLRNIPSHSKLLEPLPYVNLTQFDEDDLTSHIHIPGSQEALHHLGTSTSSLDKYTPGKKETLASLGCRSSSESHIAHATPPSTQAWEREPIYANQTKPKADPPELPPKGPALQRKNRHKGATASSRDRSAPPPLPTRNRSRSAGAPGGKVQGYDSPPPLPVRPQSTLGAGRAPPHPPLPSSQVCALSHIPPAHNSPSLRQQAQESYFEMGNFVPEPKNLLRTLQNKLSPAAAFQAQGRHCSRGQSQVAGSPKRGNADVLCYMDMTGQFEQEPTYMEPLLPEELSEKSETEPKEAGPAVLIDLTEPGADKHVYAQVLDSENNYMEMKGPKRKSAVLENLKNLQTYVSTTPAGETGSSSSSSHSSSGSSSGSTSSQTSGVEGDQSSRPAMPFPNLLRFEERLRPSAYVNTVVGPAAAGIPVSSSGDSPSQTSSSQQSSPKPPSHSSSKKEEGFLARFKRRNSRDQKAASQSQENLISGKNNRSSFLERSLSEQEAAPKESKEGGLKIGRQRSSSFPNRLSYQECTGDPGKSGSSGQGRSSVSSISSISPPPKRTSRMSSTLELVEDGNPSQESSDDTTPLLKDSGPEPNMRVLTVLHVQEEVSPPPLPERCFRRNLSYDSKTDDEKLMELLHSGKPSFPFRGKAENGDSKDFRCQLSLDMTVPVSPSQRAAEIARHVTSLPPFVPPKVKPYPAMLSPVIEVTHLSPTQSEAESIYVEMTERLEKSPTQSSASAPATLEPAEQKTKARTTLHITPPVEEELGHVWIPQASPGGSGSGIGASPSPSVSAEGHPAYMQRGSIESQGLLLEPLVVSVEDLPSLEEDSDSIVSCESSDALSVCSEDVIRSSPGTTILRPRSGREYQVVERRRTPSDSCASSPHTPQTPYSPSSCAGVFTFDSPGQSGASASAPCPHSESNSSCACSATPRSQLPSSGLDPSTPHPSHVPKSPAAVPLTPLEPQLNYAVIDLSSIPKDRTKKWHKVQRAATIEYAKIDMVATRAVQKAAQHREDTLRRSHSAVCGNYSGVSSLRKGSLPSHSRHDRRAASSSSAASASVASASGPQRESRPSTSSLEPS